MSTASETREIALTPKQAELLLDTLRSAQDEGPAPEGWQSDELKDLVNKIETQLEAQSHD